MSDQDTIIPFFSKDIQEFLINNGMDLKSLIELSGHHAVVSQGSDPGSPGTKDVVTIILASAAFAATLMPAICKVIEAVSRRPVIVKELVPIVIKNGDQEEANGDGEERMIWVEKARILERRISTEKTTLKTGFLGFKIEFSNENKG